MGLIKDFISRANNRKQKVKEYEDNERIISSVGQKKLSHNERILIKSMEEQRQELIKEALDWERRKRVAEDKMKSQSMMKFNPEHFNQTSILKQKKIFLRDGLWD